ncbi:TIGR03767 family metallophosphoesterase [Glaciihabitans sp. INWT7]|uniref:TIGR03767 family metallophosphoesterase n=1 Tax=Glaciihabitans sp. INWT7 TaxID=2596912 RepID=UPI00162A67BF|nr:TIGR03767 family metallophosphoesterase [Glaciihabitans sp. INWT7]QNE47331.1 TIGR03767 family metallophosphoesterase [Glaciihabitans sp. INWT7]
MPDVTRRSLLLSGAGGLALLSLGGLSAQAEGRITRLTDSRAFTTAGTTLEQTASASATSGYRRLVAGPGFALVVREELAASRRGRDDRRSALASIVHLTDLHIIDAQSPMRFEFMAESCPSFFRPQEALGTHAAAQLITRINQLATGPFSGRAFDCVVSTGDNSDNNEELEMQWFLRVMSGGAIVANSGAETEWEGVQHSGDPLYYNPELAVMDRYKKAGFPRIEGFFDRVIREHDSDGVKTPWYSVFGNHDDSIGGTIPANWTPLEELYTGPTKFTGFTTEAANATLAAGLTGDRSARLGREVRAERRWEVTADHRRKPFSPRGFMAAHLDPSATGAGPVGHGFTPKAADEGIAYYSFEISPGVTGIALDSTHHGGWTRGSVGHAQFLWLERMLRSGSSTSYDESGARVMRQADDRLFVLFSHHTSRSMDNLARDPADPDEKRHPGGEIVALLQRYPNVLAWVNGHSHTNAITPHPGPSPERGFWEINTASHIEFPQQARIIDVCDNQDGTLSLFTTLIESAAPYQSSYGDGDQAALASLYREFSLNDLHYTGAHEGLPKDHNTELLLPHPLH